MESQLMHIIKREWSFIMSLNCLISSVLLDALVKISIARFYFRFQDTILFISFGVLIVASLLFRKFRTSSEKRLTISQVQNCIWPAFLMYISFYLRLYHARYDARYFQAFRIASFYAPIFTLTLKKFILWHEISLVEIYLAIYVLFCGILATILTVAKEARENQNAGDSAKIQHINGWCRYFGQAAVQLQASFEIKKVLVEFILKCTEPCCCLSLVITQGIAPREFHCPITSGFQKRYHNTFSPSKTSANHSDWTKSISTRNLENK
ncbi:hypothetical protein T12_4770, partial [Trichinella patagoniensis]